MSTLQITNPLVKHCLKLIEIDYVYKYMYCIYKFYKHFPFIYIIFEKFCFINKPFIEAVVTFKVTFKTTKEINIYIMIQSAVLHVLFSPPLLHFRKQD